MMYIFKRTKDIEDFRRQSRKTGLNVGFVPTMGALHEGHLSLIRQSARNNHQTFCSIFVNPTQFNQTQDLEKYPRTPEKDLILLAKAGCTALFMPAVEEIYPPGLDTQLTIDLGGLDDRMEGRFRPGHFKGVVQVVKRLLDIVQPDRLYMGQKDYQQFCVVNRMIQTLKLPVDLIMGFTLRESDGLAMSSRNQRLSPEWRSKAPYLYKTLLEIAQNMEKEPFPALEKKAFAILEKLGFQPEYVEIADPETLQPLQHPKPDRTAVICAAAWAGEVRLIDNVLAPVSDSR